MTHEIRSDIAPPAPRSYYRIADLQPGQCLIVKNLAKHQSLRNQASRAQKSTGKRYRTQKTEGAILVHCLK